MTVTRSAGSLAVAGPRVVLAAWWRRRANGVTPVRGVLRERVVMRERFRFLGRSEPESLGLSAPEPSGKQGANAPTLFSSREQLGARTVDVARRHRAAAAAAAAHAAR
jgi:hypothetical protein